MAVAAMNRPVAMKIGPPSSASAGNFCASHSPRALAKKKTIRGPSSSTSLSAGLTLSFLSFCGSSDGSRSTMGVMSGDSCDCPGELAGRERFEVLYLLAHADEIDRQFVLG